MLYNQISNKNLRTCMFSNIESRITVSFYKYFFIINPKQFRDIFYYKLNKIRVFGRVYIASEGVNAQISVPILYFEEMSKIIYSSHPELEQIHLNTSINEDKNYSFWVLRMKVRPRIVSDGITDPAFNLDRVGHYLNAEEVNIMSTDSNVLFIDVRNYYEYEIGHFINAISIRSKTFRDQLKRIVEIFRFYKKRKIVVYCTGGIRCEKASAWLLYHGFKYVYQVKEGIIGYVKYARKREIPIRFIGKMFVFDERFREEVTSDIISRCYQCGNICDIHKNCYNNYCHALFIQCQDCFF